MSTSFDTAPLIRAEKLTAADKAAIEGVVDTVKHLNKLIEDSRPTNSEEHRKRKDDAHAVLMANPTPATIAAYKAALGNYLDPNSLFQQVHDALNHLIDIELNKLLPVAKRIHSAVSTAARDPKRFGIESAESIADVGERGEALTAFAAKHKATLEELSTEADSLSNQRNVLHWLGTHGFCDPIFG